MTDPLPLLMLFVMMYIDISSWTLAITARSQCQVWGELQHKDANYILDSLPSFFCTQGCSSTEGVSRHHNAANTICNHWSLGVTMRGPLFPSDENFLEYILKLFFIHCDCSSPVKECSPEITSTRTKRSTTVADIGRKRAML